ncbi:LIM domain transcription factor LMO4-A [Armadillidium nasatum]|uniref:LIM domain transcription factor LMO4-A n=1 Tax=Armadillidium nasatum TaxID=96803 RepID=A0A5N5SWJ6_9CRUS|nr:LIM domain transcription factor LMO4-A [Armadillidium nasatum]
MRVTESLTNMDDSKESILAFIDCYKNHSFLYNPRERMRSPRPPSTPHGPQDLTSSAPSSSTSTASSSTSVTDVFCAGCSGRINDRFYLLVVERHWHAACLRCTACHRPLDTAGKCFAKDGNIFCKEDYQRILISFQRKFYNFNL